MYLHHLFTLHALKPNKYGFRKNYINKNNILNYAESCTSFQPVLKKNKQPTPNKQEKDLARLELKACTAEN